MTDAAPRFFDLDYVEQVELRDGTMATLRLVQASDRELLREGFERLSDESRYARFLAPKTHLSDEELRYLTDVDHERHFAIGAVRGARGLGIARFIRLVDEPTAAEAAIAVTDDAQGLGLGRVLFLRLCAAAAERGVERFRCEVLGSNTGMKSLIDHVSPDRHVEVGGGILSIDFLLPNVAPTEPPTGPPPNGGMYRFFRAAARLWRESRD